MEAAYRQIADEKIMKLTITQISIEGSSGSATAKIHGPILEGLADSQACVKMHATFTISSCRRLPEFSWSHHIPGCTVAEPQFVHVSITPKKHANTRTTAAELGSPLSEQCYETFVACVANMLTYKDQLIPML